MRQEIAVVTLVVRDYDDAIGYFTGCLRFTVVEDTPLGTGKRWVVVRPPGGGTSLLLARAATTEQVARVGDQTGGRVFLFLRTDDFWRDYREMQHRGVRFVEEPREETYGTVAVFLDLYGNRWDLVQPRHTEQLAAADQSREGKDDPRSARVDRYFADRLAPQDDALAAALAANAAAGLPPHDVSPLQGRLLQVLVRAVAARKVLEIGTLGGYGTIWLARALPGGGRVVTLEANPAHAAVARANLERAGVSEAVELVVGRAGDTLPRLMAEGRGPFDLIFIDADKPSNPEYLEWAVQLSRPGTLIVGDNVVRGGAVADASSGDPNVVGVRRFVDLLAADPRLMASAVQTVGTKGYDGFAIAVVSAALGG